MGKILNIRVSAQTYSEDEVAVAWPGLCALVWPQWSFKQGVFKDPVLGPGPVEAALGPNKHGVLEMIVALRDGLKFADWPEPVRELLQGPVRELETMRKKLEQALADWDPKTALAHSNTLEEGLFALEKLFKNQ